MATKKKFDVFLSHNSKDKSWVIELKNSLEAHGIKVWLDQEEIRPGDMFAKALEIGIEESKAVALIISPESVNSGWVQAEYYRALSLATNNQLQLIPVLYKKAQLPGFLKDRSWVDFSDEEIYDENVRKLIWGVTGEKPPNKAEDVSHIKVSRKMLKSDFKNSETSNQSLKEVTSIVNQIKNPFVRDMERNLRMGNAHWVDAGFTKPTNELNYTLIYYQHQVKIFKKLQTSTRMMSTEVANGDANLLQDAFLDGLEGYLNQVILRIKQLDDLLSSSVQEFDLNLALTKSGKVILRDIEKVRKTALHASMRLLSHPDEYDQVSYNLSIELGNLSISIEEYQRHLTTIVNQAKLERIYSS